MRGFAVLYVLLYHFLPSFHGNVVGDAFSIVVRMGWSRVDFVFVHSGFLIIGVLYRSRGREDYFRYFYGRRFLQIFPICYRFVFLSAVILP